MDQIDEEILKILMENSRRPYVEIAKELNLSEGTIRKRIKKMLSLGIIHKFTIILNPKKANIFISYTGIDTDSEYLIKVIEELKKIKEIRRIFLTSGDHNLVTEIIADSLEKLKEIHKKIEELKGVKRVCPAIVTDIIK